MNIEIWKNVDGYNGLYQISSMGNVKNTKTGKNLKPSKNGGGYLFVQLFNNNIGKYYRVHRLVAEAFISNPENKPCVDHINTDKTDNRAENLRWCTHKENCNNPLTKQHNSKSKKGNKNSCHGVLGAKHWHSKPILQFTADGYFIKKWESTLDIELELGFKRENIRDVCRGKYKTSGGYVWKYYDLDTYLIGKMNNAIKNRAKVA